MSDKVGVRDYVDSVAGKGTADDLCVPLLAQADRFEDLPVSVWQQDIILKCTHGSGLGKFDAYADDKDLAQFWRQPHLGVDQGTRLSSVPQTSSLR